jgi:hypothetical protein
VWAGLLSTCRVRFFDFLWTKSRTKNENLLELALDESVAESEGGGGEGVDDGGVHVLVILVAVPVRLWHCSTQFLEWVAQKSH